MFPKPDQQFDERQAITLIVQHLLTLFPKCCPNCRRRFETLRDFFLNTTAVGDVVCFDLENGEVRPQDPVGTIALSNCPCGSTLALTSEGMPLSHLWQILAWAKREAQSRGITAAAFIQYARKETRKRVLNASAGHGKDDLRNN